MKHLVRPTVLLVFLGAAVVGLTLTVPPLPRGPAPQAVAAWWTASDGTAPMTVVHLVALGLATWATIVAALHLVVVAHPTRAARFAYRAVTTAAVRRTLGGTAVVALGLPTGAGALDGPAATPPVEPPIVLVAVEVDTPPAATGIVLRETGLAEPPVVEVAALAPAERVDPVPPATEALWRVAAGDHLWSIAEQTLHGRGLPTDEASVGRYWRRVIEANPDVTGGDPDLIHPGDTIVLPD